MKNGFKAAKTTIKIFGNFIDIIHSILKIVGKGIVITSDNFKRTTYLQWNFPLTDIKFCSVWFKSGISGSFMMLAREAAVQPRAYPKFMHPKVEKRVARATFLFKVSMDREKLEKETSWGLQSSLSKSSFLIVLVSYYMCYLCYNLGVRTFATS